jgi:hypothetical protein
LQRPPDNSGGLFLSENIKESIIGRYRFAFLLKKHIQFYAVFSCYFTLSYALTKTGYVLRQIKH